MNRLELEWETFDFFTAKIQEQEEVHLSKLASINQFLSSNKDVVDTERSDFLSEYNECCDQLLLLYTKQINSISNLITLNKDYVDIPIEREVSSHTLINLKNVTGTLMAEVVQYKEDMQLMLGDGDNF